MQTKRIIKRSAGNEDGARENIESIPKRQKQDSPGKHLKQPTQPATQSCQNINAAPPVDDDGVQLFRRAFENEIQAFTKITKLKELETRGLRIELNIKDEQLKALRSAGLDQDNPAEKRENDCLKLEVGGLQKEVILLKGKLDAEVNAKQVLEGKISQNNETSTSLKRQLENIQIDLKNVANTKSRELATEREKHQSIQTNLESEKLQIATENSVIRIELEEWKLKAEESAEDIVNQRIELSKMKETFKHIQETNKTSEGKLMISMNKMKDHSACEIQIDKLEEDLEFSRDNTDIFMKELSGLKADRISKEKEISSLVQKIEIDNQKQRDNMKEIEELRLLSEEQFTENKQLKNICVTFRDSITELQHRVKIKEEELARTESTRSGDKEFQNKFKKIVDEKDEVEKKFINISSEFERVKFECLQAKAQYDKQLGLNRDLEESNKVQQNTNADLTDSLEVTRAELKESRAKLDEAQTKMQTVKNVMQSYATDKEDLFKTIESVSQERDSMTREKESLGNELEVSQAEITHLTEYVEKFKQEKSKLTEKIQLLEAKENSDKNSIEKIRHLNEYQEKLKDEKSMMAKNIERLEAKYEDTKRKKKEFEVNRRELQEKIQLLEANNNHLEQRLVEFRELGSQKNTATNRELKDMLAIKEFEVENMKKEKENALMDIKQSAVEGTKRTNKIEELSVTLKNFKEIHSDCEKVKANLENELEMSLEANTALRDEDLEISNKNQILKNALKTAKDLLITKKNEFDENMKNVKAKIKILEDNKAELYAKIAEFREENQINTNNGNKDKEKLTEYTVKIEILESSTKVLEAKVLELKDSLSNSQENLKNETAKVQHLLEKQDKVDTVQRHLVSLRDDYAKVLRDKTAAATRINELEAEIQRLEEDLVQAVINNQSKIGTNEQCYLENVKGLQKQQEINERLRKCLAEYQNKLVQVSYDKLKPGDKPIENECEEDVDDPGEKTVLATNEVGMETILIEDDIDSTIDQTVPARNDFGSVLNSTKSPDTPNDLKVESATSSQTDSESRFRPILPRLVNNPAVDIQLSKHRETTCEASEARREDAQHGPRTVSMPSTRAKSSLSPLNRRLQQQARAPLHVSPVIQLKSIPAVSLLTREETEKHSDKVEPTFEEEMRALVRAEAIKDPEKEEKYISYFIRKFRDTPLSKEVRDKEIKQTLKLYASRGR